MNGKISVLKALRAQILIDDDYDIVKECTENHILCYQLPGGKYKNSPCELEFLRREGFTHHCRQTFKEIVDDIERDVHSGDIFTKIEVLAERRGSIKGPLPEPL